MNKKILIIILIGVLVAGGFISFLVWKHYSKPNLPLKHYCQTDSDCVLSGNDPEGFGICVNKEWYEEWEKNPESKNCKWDCIYTGKEKCGCINNRCQRIDSERECGVKETQVTITTDKTEYKQGETIKVTLENNLNESIYSYGLFQLGYGGALCLQKEDLSGDWKDVDAFMYTVTILPLVEYKAGEKKSYCFNQKIDYEEKVLAKPGRYRFEFIYYIKCKPQDSDNSLFICPSENKKTIYSNEFIIEKI